MDLSKYAKRKGEQLETIRKECALAIFTSVVQKTPVDTGRARGNWQIAVGSDNTSEIDRLDKKELGSLPSYGTEESQKLAETGDKTIYIVNNLPYANALEYGHSKQAPSGMVGLTVANMSSYVKEAIKKSGF